MKVCVYGMAGDPIHCGHYELVYELSKRFDQVWVMPCYKSIHGKSLSPFHHRMAMCSIAIHIKNVVVSPFEGMVIQDDGPKGTEEILAYLKKCYVGYDIYYAIGQDNANGITKWKNWEALLSNNKFVVFPRAEVEPTTDWYMKPPHLRIDFKPINISSTIIRQAVKNGETNILHLDPLVEDYIRREKLYIS